MTAMLLRCPPEASELSDCGMLMLIGSELRLKLAEGVWRGVAKAAMGVAKT